MLTKNQKKILKSIHYCRCNGRHMHVDDMTFPGWRNPLYYVPEGNDLLQLVLGGYVRIKRGRHSDLVFITKKGRDALPDSVAIAGKNIIEKRKMRPKRARTPTRYPYAERNFMSGTRLRHQGRLRMCQKCFTTNKPCGCGVDILTLRYEARPPRFNANKAKWEQFLKLFAPDVLKNPNWWVERREALQCQK